MSPWPGDYQGPAGGAAAAPSQPLLTVVVVGDTATCTVDGDVGAVNKVLYQPTSGSAWIEGGEVTDDGDVVIGPLAVGQYTFVAQSYNELTPSDVSEPVTTIVAGSASDGLTGTPATILAEAIITTLSLMTAPSVALTWPLYVGHMPDGKNVKDDAGAMFDTSGLKDGALMATGLQIVHEGVQLRIRARDYSTGHAKAANVVAALTTLSNVSVVVDTVAYIIKNVSQTGTIASLGMEPENKNRFLFTVNLLVTIAK